MYPHERSLVKQLADKPFAIIGVNSDSNLKKTREVVKEKNLTWRSFQNAQSFGKISDDWGITGWPTIFVLDEEGRIRYKNVRGDSMDRAVEKLLGEMGHEVKISHDEEEEDADAEEPKEKNKDAEGSDAEPKTKDRKKKDDE